MRLPDATRNPVSLLGIAVTTAMAAVFVFLLLLELFGFLSNPYSGLVTFVAIPLLFLLGLLLIPIGAWLSARRRLRDPHAREWPLIDLANPRHRAVVVMVFVLTIVNMVLVSMAAYGGLHYMERREFCGQVCHTTMEPEFVAQQAFPHATVACVACHVGAGVGPLIESKLAGTRQLYHLVTNQVPKPVPTPIRNAPATVGTCESCHWRSQEHGERPRIIREYGNDEANTESQTLLRIRIGSPAAGAHRHLALNIEYVAGDARREQIPLVRVTDGRGTVREFLAKDVSAAQFASAVRRRMECTDCHSRPAHTMFVNPERAVDAALAGGRLPRTLPFVRREAVAAVNAKYADRQAAAEGIARHLNEFYAARGADPMLVRAAVATTQEVWSRNVFPAMNVTWGTYPNHLGHVDSPGCFRCHDDEHKAADGMTIRQDCELCHSAPE